MNAAEQELLHLTNPQVTAMRFPIAMAAALVLGFIVAESQASAAPTTGATASGAVAYYNDGFNAGEPTPGPTDPNGPRS